MDFLPEGGEDAADQEDEVVKPGRTLTICEARAHALKGGAEKLVATMTGTLMALFGRTGVSG